MKKLRVRDLERECQSFAPGSFYYPQTYLLKFPLATRCHCCHKKNSSREILYCDHYLISVCSRCGDRQVTSLNYLKFRESSRSSRMVWSIVLGCVLALILAFMVVATQM